MPGPPYSMLGYTETITRTNINALLNIGPGAEGRRKKEVKSSSLPNTFDDDCSFKAVRVKKHTSTLLCCKGKYNRVVNKGQ